MIRMIIGVIYAALFFIIGMPVQLVLYLIGRKNENLRDRGARRVVQFGCRGLLAICGVKVKVEGAENLPKDGEAVLYVGNHRSFFDVFVGYPYFPSVTGYVAKKEFAVFWPLRYWVILVRGVFIDRNDMKQSMKAIVEAIQNVKKGISMVIYPEGTRSRGESELDMLPFKEGSMKIAEKARCPVIPMAMTHTQDIFEKQFPLVKPQHVTLRFGEPVDLSALPKEERKFSGNLMRDKIRGMLEEMLAEENTENQKNTDQGKGSHQADSRQE
ncbi:MAG: lysophospholipid acyltransferase family protein [Lachnospiraceae bacterium]|jgi:1-acyl-sn-glycerol-3-phosphate acyltransferase